MENKPVEVAKTEKQLKAEQQRLQAQAWEQQKQMEKEREFQIKQMEKRLHWLEVTAKTRELEQTIFGQEEVIKSLKRQATIDVLVDQKKEDKEIITYLVGNGLGTPQEAEMVAKEKEVKPLKVVKEKE